MIDILLDDDVLALLSDENIIKAVEVSCFEAKAIKKPTLCIRFAANTAVQMLNAQWRNQDKVTDVLSFPMQEADALDSEEPLGDIILAAPFVVQEARRLNLAAPDHATHLVVHGVLHLLGFDHIADDAAKEMQQLENKVMGKLGLHQPYPEDIRALQDEAKV